MLNDISLIFLFLSLIMQILYRIQLTVIRKLAVN